MANTHFLGPVNSTNGFVAQAYEGAATNLADKDDVLNTKWKYAGKQVTDLTDGLIYTAVGSTATSAWVASDGTSTITPA